VRPPYEVRDPARQQDFWAESIDEWRVRLHFDNLLALHEPRSFELGGQDRRILDWVAGWDIPTLGAITSLLHRARAAHPATPNRRCVVSRTVVVRTDCDWACEPEYFSESPGLFVAGCPECGGWLDLGEVFDHAPQSTGSAKSWR